jgi:hypothetical protein
MLFDVSNVEQKIAVLTLRYGVESSEVIGSEGNSCQCEPLKEIRQSHNRRQSLKVNSRDVKRRLRRILEGNEELSYSCAVLEAKLESLNKEVLMMIIPRNLSNDIKKLRNDQTIRES